MNFFDDKFRYTDKAIEFESELHSKVYDTVLKYFKMSYSPREMQYLISNVAFDICTDFVLAGVPDEKL